MLRIRSQHVTTTCAADATADGSRSRGHTAAVRRPGGPRRRAPRPNRTVALGVIRTSDEEALEAGHEIQGT